MIVSGSDKPLLTMLAVWPGGGIGRPYSAQRTFETMSNRDARVAQGAIKVEDQKVEARSGGHEVQGYKPAAVSVRPCACR